MLGSLTPSMANISRPMRPMRSQMSRISVNRGPISPSRVLTKAAKVVKCGAVSPLSAMKVTCSWQARSMSRLLMIPRE